MKKILALVVTMLMLAGCSGSGGGGGETTPAPTSTTLHSVEVRSSGGDLTLAEGEKIQLAAIGIMSDGKEQNISSSVVWSSSSMSVASVSQTGLVTALSAGPATITVTAVGGVHDSTEITVNGTPPPFASPGSQLTQVTTDGNNRLFATGRTDEVAAWSAAIRVSFDASGAIPWQKSDTLGAYGESQATPGGIYATRVSRNDTTNTYTSFVEKIDTVTGGVVSSTVTGTTVDPNGTTAPYPGSLAISSDAVYVATSSFDGSKMEIYKLGLALGEKELLHTFDSSQLQDLEVSMAGGFFYSIHPTSVDVFTFEGIHFGHQEAPPWASFLKTVAYSDKLYVAGSQLTLTGVQATIWVYGLDGGLQSTFPLGPGHAGGMAIGPGGEMYVAVGEGGLGPVRLDPTTGAIAWTGNAAGQSVAYLNGEVALADGSDVLKVFDSATGARL